MTKFATAFIGMAFATAVIVFFGMGKLPAEVFCSLATGAIVWFFKNKEHQAEITKYQAMITRLTK